MRWVEANFDNLDKEKIYYAHDTDEVCLLYYYKGWRLSFFDGSWCAIGNLKIKIIDETPIVFPSEDEIVKKQNSAMGENADALQSYRLGLCEGIDIGASWAIQKIKEQL